MINTQFGLPSIKVESNREYSGTSWHMVKARLSSNSMADGSTSIRVQATDEVGHISEVAEVSFELDVTRPVTPAQLVLSFSGDWGPMFDSAEHPQTEGWPDFWAGDALAVDDFKREMQQRHGQIQRIWSIWKQPDPLP